MEEAYIAEEERILSEQTAEMEDLITAQGGDNTIRKGELEVQQGKMRYIKTDISSPPYFLTCTLIN